MNSRTVLYSFTLFFAIFCAFSCRLQKKDGNLKEDKVFEEAFCHAEQANEALVRCNSYVESWPRINQFSE